MAVACVPSLAERECAVKSKVAANRKGTSRICGHLGGHRTRLKLRAKNHGSCIIRILSNSRLWVDWESSEGYSWSDVVLCIGALSLSTRSI